ncbi:MAG TPA: NAD(P)/FAD-dependent oxidoreductase [Xanthobacteraceae bacterium]|nr:NAD(P)/FAD-dependent oxidoreductase [Xanthobacteraceae bacterium]
MGTAVEEELTLERQVAGPQVTAGDTATKPVHVTDVAIVGGGLAGSLAAAMLGRAGIDAVLIDPRTEYPPDFRCEKLDGDQVAILKKTGIAEAVMRAATPDRESWVARFGRLVDKRPGDQLGIFYAPLVNTVRAEIPQQVVFINAKATALATGPEVQTVTTSTGATVRARLIVLANGLNIGLRDSLKLKREILSGCHSISIGFDIHPVGAPEFKFPALTYYADQPSDRTALLTLFPIGQTMRANLFVYRDMDDPWLQKLRAAPERTLLALMPGLGPIIGNFAVSGHIKIRPVDLYATHGHLQPGIVLVGDAFSTSCPAAGTGARKVLTDVERLCNVYVPRWLATSGMGVDKIAAFYADPVKQACDRFSLNKAYALRAFSTDPRMRWRARRWIRFAGQYGVGKLRLLRRWLTSKSSAAAMPRRREMVS